MFNLPDHISLAQDLSGDGNPTDQCNHGTASAGLITGNGRLGANWRGVSAISVDSFDVYGNDCLVGGADTVAGFQEAVSWLDKVIVAEVQLTRRTPARPRSPPTPRTTPARSSSRRTATTVPAPAPSALRATRTRRSASAPRTSRPTLLMEYSGRGPSSDGR